MVLLVKLILHYIAIINVQFVGFLQFPNLVCKQILLFYYIVKFYLQLDYLLLLEVGLLLKVLEFVQYFLSY